MEKCLLCRPCGDSKHSGAVQEFSLAIIQHSCDNCCWLQVCGQPKRVYLEMNLKSRATGSAHNPDWMEGGKKLRAAIEVSFTARGVVQKLLHRGPLGLGVNTGVNGIRISSNMHLFDIEKYSLGNALH